MIGEKVKISDVLWFQEGPGVRNTQYTSEGIKLLNVANLVDGKVDLSTSSRYISEDEAYGKYKHFLVDEGDFIIASSGIKVEYFEKKMGFVDSSHLPLCMNTSTIRFKAIDKDIIDIRYFMYYLKSEQFKAQLSKQITGSAQLNFGPSHLNKMYMPIPDMEQQKYIVGILDLIYKIEDNRKEQLRKLDELVKARFVELFGDPSNNPNSFNVVTFNDCVEYMGDIGSNGANKVVVEHLDMKDEEDYALMVRFLNFTKNDFTDDVKYVSKEAYDFFKKSQIFGGELIICKIGSAGQNYVMPYLNRPVSLGLNQIMVRINDKTLMPYLYQYLNTDYGKQLIDGCINGAVTKSITKTELKKIPVIVPPMELQQQFAAFVEQTDKSKLEVQKSLEKLELLKKALMQKYFG